MKTGSVRFASLLALPALLTACGVDDRLLRDASGAVDLSLELGSGATIETAHYVITGPAGFSRMGDLDVAGSSTISAQLTSFPPGAGYVIALSATTTGGGTECAGSAEFDVTMAETTPVDVKLLCQEAPRTGSVLVNGTLNVCPTLRGIAGTPTTLLVGQSVRLLSLAHDLDAQPDVLTYAWTVTQGTLDDPAADEPMFTCAAEGLATITLTVSDGDTAPGCAASAVASIQCVIPIADAGTGTDAGVLGDPAVP